MRRPMALALAMLAAGCALTPAGEAPAERPETVAQAAQRRAHAPSPAYNLAGYPPAAREGYIDGCESAKGSEYARKDARRMAADAQYATGWNDGYSLCRR